MFLLKLGKESVEEARDRQNEMIIAYQSNLKNEFLKFLSCLTNIAFQRDFKVLITY